MSDLILWGLMPAAVGAIVGVTALWWALTGADAVRRAIWRLID